MTHTPHTHTVWGRYRHLPPAASTQHTGSVRQACPPAPFYTGLAPFTPHSVHSSFVLPIPFPCTSPIHLHSPINPLNTLDPQLYIPNSCKVPVSLWFLDSLSISVTDEVSFLVLCVMFDRFVSLYILFMASPFPSLSHLTRSSTSQSY